MALVVTTHYCDMPFTLELSDDNAALFRLQAQLLQDGQLMATARGAFMPPKYNSGILGVTS
jgi:hypothetical protein